VTAVALASGTSLRTEMANANGMTNRHSAQTGPGTVYVPASEELKCSATARLTHERPDAGDAQRGQQREALQAQGRDGVGRADGQAGEHAAELHRALREREDDGNHGAHRHDPTGGEHAQLARRDRQERLVDRSISTSSSWLMPTM
jgi:hypothetical protein